MADDELEGWMLQLRAGDPEGLRGLLERFGPRLTRLALGFLGDPSQAEDTVQDTLVAAWRGARSYRDGSDPGAWLVTICLNLCRTRIRAHTREHRAISQLARRTQPSPPRADAGAEAAEFRTSVLAELEKLPAPEREAFLLIVVGQMTSMEAAAAMGCSPASARVRLGRARRMLAESLGKTKSPVAPPPPLGVPETEGEIEGRAV